MELLKYSEDGNDDKMAYLIKKIKLNGGCCLFFFFFLPVCVQALGTPAPDRPVHLQDLTVIAMTMGEQMRNNPRKHNRRGWQLRQAK